MHHKCTLFKEYTKRLFCLKHMALFWLLVWDVCKHDTKYICIPSSCYFPVLRQCRMQNNMPVIFFSRSVGSKYWDFYPPWKQNSEFWLCRCSPVGGVEMLNANLTSPSPLPPVIEPTQLALNTLFISETWHNTGGKCWPMFTLNSEVINWIMVCFGRLSSGPQCSMYSQVKDSFSHKQFTIQCWYLQCWFGLHSATLYKHWIFI